MGSAVGFNQTKYDCHQVINTGPAAVFLFYAVISKQFHNRSSKNFYK